jgi:type 1 glutamine amidotransferase
MKKALLVTDGLFHPTLLGRIALHRALQQLKDFSFTHVSSLEELPSDLGVFSAFVLHYHHKTISNIALGKLDQYVKNGGGILAIHAATASFKESLPYFEILGGRFTGHGAVEEFEARRVSDEIFDGIDSFVVNDELYIHELQPGIQVHFTTPLDGKEVPVLWTYRYGEGKVCYAVPGHRTESMRNKTYQQILQRGLMWVSQVET